MQVSSVFAATAVAVSAFAVRRSHQRHARYPRFPKLLCRQQSEAVVASSADLSPMALSATRLNHIHQPKLHARFEDLAPGVAEKNFGFMCLKPTANTKAAREFVEEKMNEFGIEILEEGDILAEEIEERKIVDVHYGSMASKAWDLSPGDLVVRLDRQAQFETQFGISWSDALARGLVCNAREACDRLGCGVNQLDDQWDPLEIGKGKVKFGGGFYCGRIQDIYVINGFYMAMRSMYTKPGRSVHWYSVSWKASKLRWSDFRENVLGATDPATASENSMRGASYRKWKELDLPGLPHVGENVVHASASPFEAALERCNWLGRSPLQDPFCRQLEQRGISMELIRIWSKDPIVVHDGRQLALFDLFENLDGLDCLDLAADLQSADIERCWRAAE